MKSCNKTVIDFNFGRHKDLSTLKSDIHLGLATLVNYHFFRVDKSFPYGKADFVRISEKYAANILRTALFTVIVRDIFTSCRDYPANKVGLTKKVITECFQFVI